MQSPLQKLWQLEHDFGYTADEATQALIDQAEAQGLVGEKAKPVQEQMLDAMLAIKEAALAIAAALGVVPAEAEKAAGGLSRLRVPPINIPVNIEWGPGGDVRYFHDPNQFRNQFPSDTAPQAAVGGRVTTTGIEYFDK